MPISGADGRSALRPIRDGRALSSLRNAHARQPLSAATPKTAMPLRFEMLSPICDEAMMGGVTGGRLSSYAFDHDVA